MLHSTFIKKGGDVAHAHGGHDAAHGHGHGHGAKAIHIIERSAPYTHTSSLSWFHFHTEPNFRKKPLGWGAYKHADVFAPFHATFPIRHCEKSVLPGIWFGWGHIHTKYFGPYNWVIARKWWGISFGGTAMTGVTYWWRMYRNGWETKNRGAVSGM